jgi:DNA-binding transcriptional LysR family regulator
MNVAMRNGAPWMNTGMSSGMESAKGSAVDKAMGSVGAAGPALAQALFVARSVGPVGWAGVAALLLAAVGAALIAPGLERANAAQAREVEQLQNQWSQLRDPKAARAQRDPVGTLVAGLPSVGEVPDFVAAIQRRADQNAVQIDRTEYRVQSILGHSAQRYRLSFPAHVDYPHLRTWLESLLHDYPNLTLDEITLRRAVDGGEELDVHIGLSFLARESR